jgi:ATP-dependent DNA ligase
MIPLFAASSSAFALIPRGNRCRRGDGGEPDTADTCRASRRGRAAARRGDFAARRPDPTQALGALLVGYYEGDELRYAGKVGTGFSEKVLDELGRRLGQLETDRSPFAKDGLPREARWVEPRLVGQFAFTEWTRDGKLRHPRYLGLREDKHPREVVREVPR